MGCQCNNQKEDLNEEISKNDNLEDLENNNNDQKDEIFGLANHDGFDPEKLIESNNENENQLGFEFNEKLNEDKNVKYSNYPKRVLNLINKIRENPSSYSDFIIDSINNIIINQEDDDTKPKIIYKNKVKVALAKGEEAFHLAAEILKNMDPLPPLELKEEICVPMPESEDELKDNNYIKNKVNEIRKNYNIDIFYKDLIKIPEVSVLLMIVDDSEKNPGKKRNSVLSEDFKYIGISNKFYGKKFYSYFTFSK